MLGGQPRTSRKVVLGSRLFQAILNCHALVIYSNKFGFDYFEISFYCKNSPHMPKAILHLSHYVIFLGLDIQKIVCQLQLRMLVSRYKQ